MATQPIPRPVEGCEKCQKWYQGLIDLYRLWAACPADPGAHGLFEARREHYEQHHQESHNPAENEAASC